jgi:hypothetical protein
MLGCFTAAHITLSLLLRWKNIQNSLFDSEVNTNPLERVLPIRMFRRVAGESQHFNGDLE